MDNILNVFRNRNTTANAESFNSKIKLFRKKTPQLKLLQIILDLKVSTIAALYRRRWDIETFFKLLKQNLNVKTFVSTSPNGVKSQIFVALITFLPLELLRRVKAKRKTAFSNFVEKIRICLCYYLTLDYVIL
ncbi:MAG: transposase [Bacteroidetes bacterium]|nr:transposase [Bacteroidota bacterium]